MDIQRVIHNDSYGLWLIMMCQCHFIDYSKAEYGMLMVGQAECVQGGEEQGEELCGNSVLSTQFCCELKSVLKIKPGN